MNWKKWICQKFKGNWMKYIFNQLIKKIIAISLFTVLILSIVSLSFRISQQEDDNTRQRISINKNY